MTGSDFGDDKDLNEIKTDYGDDKDLNQVETHYGDDDDYIKIKTNYEDNEDDDEIETNYGNDKESIYLEVATCRNPPLPHSYPAIVPDPSNETVSIAEFHMIQSSLPADPMAFGLGFLTSAANWKRRNTQDIYARMLEVSRIRQAIHV